MAAVLETWDDPPPLHDFILSFHSKDSSRPEVPSVPSLRPFLSHDDSYPQWIPSFPLILDSSSEPFFLSSLFKGPYLKGSHLRTDRLYKSRWYTEDRERERREHISHINWWWWESGLESRWVASTVSVREFQVRLLTSMILTTWILFISLFLFCINWLLQLPPALSRLYLRP